MGRDEHFDEIELFDGFFLAVIVFLMAARVGYTAIHIEQLGSWVRGFALFAYPGLSVNIGLCALAIFVYFFARAKNWEVWKVTDAFVVALSIALLIGSIGGFLNGSNPGKIASWGLMYPGESQARIPADIWTLLWSIVAFVVTSRVRKNFRFYAWYKGESSMAQEGLATLMFGILGGFYFVVNSLLIDTNWLAFGKIPFESIVGIVLVAGCSLMIKNRVGRRDASMWGKLKNIIRR